MRVYASENEYQASPWKNTLPPQGQLLGFLARASIEVERLTANAFYDTDPNGLPIENVIANAFRDATCAQVAYWCNTGDPDGAGAAVGAVAIGSVRLGAGQGGAGQTSGGTGSRTAPEALTILHNAGLITPEVNAW